MTKLTLIGLVFILTFITSCESKSTENESLSESANIVQANAARSGSSTANDESSSEKKEKSDGKQSQNAKYNKKKIIKDGNLSLKATNLYKSKSAIDKIIKTHNAYYEAENLYKNDEMISYDLKIRIPSQNFEKLISEIEKGDNEVTNKSIHARDVTEEYFDLETRLINKRAYLKRYQELLAKANSINDILAIEEKIRAIEEEIESKEGRLKYLNDQIGYSTLDIHLYQELEHIDTTHEDSFFTRLAKALGNGWDSIVTFILWILSIWPFVIIITVSTIGIKRYLRKKKLNK